MKVNEIVYAVLDMAKASGSDDSFVTEEHIIFLLKKYRSFLIKKEQDREKSTSDVASVFETQEICLPVVAANSMEGISCHDGYYLKSTVKIPKILEGNTPRVYPHDFYENLQMTYVSRDRMRYIGSNSYLKNIVYSSVGPDQYLYMKSLNPQFKYLSKVRMSAVFEDFDAAAEYLCDETGESKACDVLDEEFPIRSYLVPTLIELVVKEITGMKYQKADTKNDSRDNLPDMVKQG